MKKPYETPDIEIVEFSEEIKASDSSTMDNFGLFDYFSTDL